MRKISGLVLAALCAFSHAKIVEQTFEGDTNDIVDARRISYQNGTINLTMPGTKWCGPGNTAANYNDLGMFNREDECCRAHDNCDSIPGKGTKYGLTNNDVFTVLNCGCDQVLKQCLKALNSPAANKIGRVYFSLRNRCYKESFPIVSCIRTDTKIFVRRCMAYNVDENQPKKYQWFDLPFYESAGNGIELSDFDETALK